MQVKRGLLLLPVALVIMLFTEGCAKKGGETVDFAELGFSMTLPEGWQADSHDPYLFYSKRDRQNTFGGITTVPSKGTTLFGFVDRLVETGMVMEQAGEQLLSGSTGVSETEIVSRTHRGINGLNSVELVIRREGYHVFTVWLPRGQDIVRISFQVPDDKFPAQKDSLVKTARSIKLK